MHYGNNIYITVKMFSITETTKGRKCLLFHEYRYHRERICNTTTYWRCERLGNFHARVVQKGDGLLS
ncbi:unnamed protein product [Rotaria sp. Silwood1]|nr:unnamed protein product [Rotaria sp. Silwood1]